MILCIPKVWELLRSFKDQCRLRGWKTSEHEDWVKTDNEYHNFLWIQTIHQSTFDKICATRKTSICRRIYYKVIDISYAAWLFPRSQTGNLMQIVKESPEYSTRIALYDLSRIYHGKPLCLKLNETTSIVFQEFEKFLEKELGLEIKSIEKLPASRVQRAHRAFAL